MQKIRPQSDDDIAIVDCEPRILVSIAAQYALTDWCDSRSYRRKFACRLIGISSREVTLLAPVAGAVGGRVITHCSEFGKLDGSITRVLDRGFVVRIAATERERRKLAARVEGYEKFKNYDIVDRRAHKRIVPINPSSTLFLGDGSQTDCFIIDISTTGVAVSADIQLEIGTPLAIRSLVGRVVRHLDDGFAVQFVHAADVDSLEQKLIAPAAQRAL
jgi:hypothetical protein